MDRVQPGSGRRAGWAAGALAVLTAAAYLPALRGGFVWDDDHFLTRNPLIQSAAGLGRFWVSAEATDYWPATSTSLWLEWRLWGMQAAGYHAVNLLLHLAAAWLLMALLRRWRVPGAFLAAAIFAVHPVNVESVAWITQRKNLLAMVFFLSAILAFDRSEAGAKRPAGSAASYGLSLAAFTLAMLSKGSVAPLPLVLLGWVAWRRRPRARDYWRLAPFIAVAVVLSAVDVWFQRHGVEEVIRRAGFFPRLLGAGEIVWFYFSKAILPARLSFCYPQWAIRADDPRAWLPLLALGAVAVAIWRGRGGRRRPLLFGLGYFLAMLVPVMGFTDVYFMKYSLVADHYEHLALIGVAVLAGAGLTSWSERVGAASWRRPAGTAAALLLVAGFGALTWRQSRVYFNRETLFRSVLTQNPESWMAQNNLGLYLIEGGRYGESLPYCQAAVRLQPDFAEAHNNLGIALAGLSRLPESVAQFRAALTLKPQYPEAWNNLGNAFRLQGKGSDSIGAYVEALRQRPGYAEGHNNLGVALMDAGRLPEAMAQLGEAVRLEPDYTVARENLALAVKKAQK